MATESSLHLRVGAPLELIRAGVIRPLRMALRRG